MESAILKCNILIEYHNSGGSLVRKERYKSCMVRLFRNPFREMFLELRGSKNKTLMREELRNVILHKNFMHEGKATIRFPDISKNVFISNAPPSELSRFMKLLTIKLMIRDEAAKTGRKKHHDLKALLLRDVSPVTEKDVEKAKAKQNHPEKATTSAAEASEEKEEKEVEPRKNCLQVMTQHDLDDEQKEILQAVKCGQNIFFTGAAGTGKSHVLKCIMAVLPPETTFITASTAVAACQLGGVTLHQFAGLGTGGGTVEQCVVLASRPGARKVWRKCEHLLIDEISMIPGDFFDKLEHVARVVRKSDKPFGGIQLILSGDFFQLPPIGKNATFCFEAKAWDKCVTRSFELTKVYRQTDPIFVNMLQDIRMGIVSRYAHNQLLCTASQNIEQSGILPTILCTHTADASATNKFKLEELEGEAKIFTARDNPPSSRALMDKQLPVSSLLALKPGAQVMLVKNINPASGLVNGARGVVVKFDSDGLPVVKFRFVTHTVQREKFVMKLGDGSILSRLQLPLCLAWGCSVHKSQGMTLDCVEVSLSRVFGPGHAYVALSRVRSLDCLRVLQFDPRQVWADKRVLDFHDKLRRFIRLSKPSNSCNSETSF